MDLGTLHLAGRMVRKPLCNLLIGNDRADFLVVVVFTFGGPGGFRTYQAGPRRPRQAADGEGNTLTALLPILLVLVFSIITILPSILSTAGTPDPSYSFEPSTRLSTGRESFNWKVPYFVNKQEWEQSEIWKSVPEARRGAGSEALYSSKVRQFEKGVEGHYVRRLQNEVSWKHLIR